MRQRKKLIGLFAAVLLLAFAFFIALSSSSDSLMIDGRSVEEWVEQMQNARPAERAEIHAKLLSIGAAATPTLVRLLGTTDFPFEARYTRLRMKHARLLYILPAPSSAFMLRNSITQILKDTPREHLLLALGDMKQLLSSREPDVRSRAATLLASLGPEAADAMPFLVAAIHEDSSYSMVVHAIRRIGLPQATNAIPSLSVAMHTFELPYRITAAQTLEFLAPDTPGLPEALVDIVEQGTDAQKSYALNSLLILSWRAIDVAPRLEAEADRTFVPRTQQQIRDVARSIRRSHEARTARLGVKSPP